MTVRGRLLSTIGVGTRWQEAPDAPPPESVSGRCFLLDADDVRRELEEGRAALGAIDVPEGFRPLSLTAAQAITHKLQTSRLASTYPGAPGLPLCFRPSDGTFIGAFASLDTVWPSEHGPPDPAKLVTIDLCPLPQGALHGRDYRPPGLGDVHDAAVADARELGTWYFDPDDERTWKVGTPHPAPPVPDLPVEMLSARATRSITRSISTSLDQLPRAVLADGIVVSFSTDGVPAGLAFTPWPPEKHIQVTLTLDSDPADIPGFLARVRICRPSGRVVVLDPVPS